MNIVKPYAKICGPLTIDEYGISRLGEFTKEDGVDLLRRIEYFGRFSHATEDAQTDTSWERFIKAVVMEHGDWSIVEHAAVTVDFLVDRGVTHELVRHRLFSFTQSSTRFINYVKKISPTFLYPQGEGVQIDSDWQEAIEYAEHKYKNLLRKGWAPQLARSVFPNALSSRIATTGNLRNWRHFFIMRTTRETHPQFREVTIPLLADFQVKIPLLFDDIEPMAKQSDALKKAR